MRKTSIALAVLFALLPGIAAAQQILPKNTVWGRLGVTASGPAQAIPFAALFAGMGIVTGPQSCASHNWFNSLSSGGAFACSQPAYTDISGSPAGPSFTLTNFGAVSGLDINSRNSNAITNAIAACQTAGGGTIWVPAGNYQYATAASQTASNCSFAGEGQGASILTYTGTGTAITIGPSSGSGNNIINIAYRSIQIACSAACANAVLVHDVEQSIVFDNVGLNAGGLGSHALQLTSLTSSTGGTFSVHIVNGSFIANCTSTCLFANPLGAALTQAIFIDHTFFNGYAGNALSITTSSGLFITNCRFEHHPGTSNTTPAVHVDTTSKVGIRNNYFEDDSNAVEIEVGGAVQSLDIIGNYFTLNVTGAAAAGIYAIKQNGSTTAPASVNIKDNAFLASGTIGKMVDFSATTASQIHIEDNYVNMGNGTTVFDFGAATASRAISNSVIVGTVGLGINSSVGQSAVDVSGNSSSGTFSTAFTNATAAVSCATTPGASFTTNYAGKVTHC